MVHRYVEQMDKYYGNVCELDIIFNFQKAYFILDELLIAGEMQETSKKNVLRCISQQDSLEDMEVSLDKFLLSSWGLPLSFIKRTSKEVLHGYIWALYPTPFSHPFLPQPWPSFSRANYSPG